MKVLIVDDEPMPSKRLASLIKKHCFEIEEVEIFNTASKALERIGETQFDIIFLDVEMPEMTGFDFLEHAIISRNTHIIVTTAYEQYAIKAFKANAVHYLLKPVTKEDLINGIRKVARIIMEKDPKNLFPESKTISIFHNDEYHLIQEEDIIRLEADSSYTNFIMEDKKLMSSKSLRFFEELLTKSIFFRCHNSHIINLKQIEKYGKGRGGYVHLKNGDIVPISFSKKADLIKLVGH